MVAFAGAGAFRRILLYRSRLIPTPIVTVTGTNDVRFSSTRNQLTARRSLIYQSLTAPVGPTGPSPGSDDVQFATTRTTRVSRQALLYRSITTPLRVDEVAVEIIAVYPATIRLTGQEVTPPSEPFLFPQDQTSILARWSLLYPPGTSVPLVTGPGIEIIPVYPAGIRFTGQEVTLTGQGEVRPPIGGGGGVTVPPWIDYGRKHRRRYRALEEIEKRLDERIKRLETEKAELDGPQGQQVGVQLAAPDLTRFLLNFEQLLNRQAAINAALLEAQRRAELVRQERIQLAILAQRAAEAIDEEEAITMLLLT